MTFERRIGRRRRKNKNALGKAFTQETEFQSLSKVDSLEREWLPTLVFLPGEFHGQRRLAGYSYGVAKSQI